MSGTVNSHGIEIYLAAFVSITAVWTGGTAAGTLKLQVSNDMVKPNDIVGGDPAVNVVNWVDYTGSSTNVAGAGNFGWNMAFQGYYWVRLVYTPSGGAGTINAILVEKQ